MQSAHFESSSDDRVLSSSLSQPENMEVYGSDQEQREATVETDSSEDDENEKEVEEVEDDEEEEEDENVYLGADDESKEELLEPIKKGLKPTEMDDNISRIFEAFPLGISRENVPKVIKRLLLYTPYIKRYGLSADHLEKLFYLALSDMPYTLVAQVTEILLPRDYVPEMLVIRVIGKIGRAGRKLKAINNLLKWIICVYDRFESTTFIKKFYQVIFFYVGYVGVRSSICHLLYFMTTSKKDVIPYRIERLQKLIETERDNTHLIGLLMVYQSFNNTIKVPSNVRLTNMFVFEHPDPDFNVNLKLIDAYWGNEDEEEDYIIKPSLSLSNNSRNLSRKRDTKKLDTKKRVSKKRMKETEIRENVNILSLYDDLQKLRYSDQLQVVLDDHKIQHLLVCNPDDTIIQRLSYYIGHELLSTVRWNNTKDKQELQELLQKLLKLAQFSKSQFAIVNMFLKEYLKSWNGIEFQNEIFGLLGYIKPADYEEIYRGFLLPLYKKYYVMDVFWKCKLINCYTEWLKNWALLDWRGHKEQENKTSATEVDKITWMFEGLSLRVDYFITLQKVVEHVDKISVMGLLAENDHPLLQHSALSFFELIATIPLDYDIPEIIVPSIDFVCRCFFSSNAMALSRMCGIIHQYLVAFVENDEKDEDWISRHTSDYLTMFNTYVTDICTALWKNKAFTLKGNATAFGLSEKDIENFTEICEKRGVELKSFASITQSGALAGYSKRFLQSLEKEESVKHSKVVTASSLKELQEQGGIEIDYFEYRVKYLNYLSSKGFKGIEKLLSSTMKSLIEYQEQQN